MNYIALIPLIFVIYLLIIDFVDLYPFNDVTKHKPHDRKIELVNYCLFSAVGVYSWLELPGYVWVSFILTCMLVVGYVFVWYVPYFRGHYSEYTRQEYEYSFSKTIKILPPIKDHPIPDLEHMFVGVFIVVWFVVTLLNILG